MKTIILSILVSTFVCIAQEEAKISVPECLGNEHWEKCPSNCPPICNTEQLICTTECKGACVCNKGYIRSKCGGCIPIEDCKSPECPENENYQCCASYCPPICGKLSMPCIQLCKPDTCVCNDGYIRSKGGKCIKIEDCQQCYPNSTS